MSRKVFAQIRQQWIGALALFLVLAGGTAYAVAIAPKNSVDSAAIIGGAVKKSDLGRGAVARSKLHANAVDSARVLDNSLAGRDINASTLGTVPNAAKLDGLTAARVHFDQIFDTSDQGYKPILDLGGLQLKAKCYANGAFVNISVVANTTTSGAVIHAVGTTSDSPSTGGTPNGKTYDSSDLDFGTNEDFSVLPTQSAGFALNVEGTLVYSSAGGSDVTLTFQNGKYSPMGNHCLFVGTALSSSAP